MRATRVIRTLTAALVVSALAASPATANPGDDLPDVPTEDYESGTVENPLLTVHLSGVRGGASYDTFMDTNGPLDSFSSEGRLFGMSCGHSEPVVSPCDTFPEFEVDVVVADRDTSEGRLRISTEARAEVEGQELVDHDESTQVQCSQSAVNGAACDAVALVDGTTVTVPLPTPLLWPILVPVADTVQQVIELAIEVLAASLDDATGLLAELLPELPAS